MACARVMRGTSSTARRGTPDSIAGSRAAGAGEADGDGAGLDPSLIFGGGGVDHGQNIGRGEQAGAIAGQSGSCQRIRLVAVTRCQPGTGFDGNLKALGNEGLDGVWEQGDSSLPGRGFFQDCKAQDMSSRLLAPRCYAPANGVVARSCHNSQFLCFLT